jgi:hypothetical protein
VVLGSIFLPNWDLGLGSGPLLLPQLATRGSDWKAKVTLKVNTTGEHRDMEASGAGMQSEQPAGRALPSHVPLPSPILPSASSCYSWALFLLFYFSSLSSKTRMLTCVCFFLITGADLRVE